jgi:cellobiose phosphorylase
MTAYGYFDDAAREYVITDPHTPAKWINYVGTLAFGGFVDHTGGALICKGDPALNRITKYIQQTPASDFKGATLYLRLPENGGYKVFSPTYVPTLDTYTTYRCHVGLGYTRIVSEFYGLRTGIATFVPPGADVLVQDITVTNMGSQPQEIDAAPVVEYTHPAALKQLTNADWVPQTMQSDAYGEPGDLIVLAQYPFMYKETRINYLTSNRPVSSYETDRRRLLGANEYGTWARPLGLHWRELSNYAARRGDNVGALLHHLGVLAPGESTRLIVLLGQAASVDAARPTIDTYRDPAAVDAAFDEMAAFWRDYLDVMQVETPDAAFDTMLNVHNPRQCHTTKNWSRYLSYYQLGLGARGIGFRDSSQDILGVVSHLPGEARDFLKTLLGVQKRDGSAMHQFNPVSMEANEGDSREREEGPHFYSDDHLWAVLAVCAYLKETGDLALLDEEVPYYDKDKDDRPIESETALDHLLRGIGFTRRTTGAHGLPLLGYADWNDTVNLREGAESVFTASLYGRALRDLIDLFEHMGEDEAADLLRLDYDGMRERVNACAWDGGWYVRYFGADGGALGSQANRAGQIYANAQSWPVLAGFAPRERARQALDAVYERLNTANGIKLSVPGYDGYDPDVGGVSTYPPGAKENGGIFLHANPWVIIAEAMMGNGSRAYEYYRQINPAAKNEIADEYEMEPYVYPQNILGDEHPQFGLARNSWLSGTASWMYQAGTGWILGVRADYGGLRVAPCIPAAWTGFRARREFRGATYDITVHNPDGVERGVVSFTVDGEAVGEHIAPVFGDGRVHTVEVLMGRA